MLLYIVRHGKAEDAGAYLRDADRPLTARGIDQARFLGSHISTGAHPPELILASGFNRAFATARIIHEAVGCRFKLVTELECDNPVGPVTDLIEQHARRPGSEGTISSMMLVGHNPQVGELCTVLTNGLAGSEMMLCTGEAVCLEVRPGDLIGTGRLVERLRLEQTFATR